MWVSSGVARTAGGEDRWSSTAGANSSSSETLSSVTIAYSVRTDGCVLPVSIWETRLGETSSRRASSRRLRPRRSRSTRRRVPRVSSPERTCSAVLGRPLIP